MIVEVDITSTNPFRRRVEYMIDDKSIAYMEYSIIYDRMELDNIKVEDEYRNQGIGTKMMAHLVSLAIEEMIVNIININESVDAIDVIVRKNEDNILIAVKDNGIDFNQVVENAELQFDNISVLNKIAEKIDYSRVLGLNSTVITINN